MDKLREVTYCGVYCPNCGTRCQVPQRAASLVKALTDACYDEWGSKDVLGALKDLAVESTKSCRDDTCGAPGCAFKKCAKSKGVVACPLCADFPCEELQLFYKSNPTQLFDGKRMKEIGIDLWIEEQDARRKNGFCYGDIRCGKDIIPQG